jgi:hypothetical protein
MKKFFLIFIPAIIIALIFIPVFHLVMSFKEKGALQVTSFPESKVYLDGNYIGTTPLCKCEATDMLKAGSYTVRLVPENKDLSEFQEKITISSNVLTVVDRKFAKDSLSEGSVISLTPLKDKKKTELLIVSLPEGSTILLDDSEIGKTPFSFKDPTESDHVLTVRKTGYKEKIIRIRTPLGYKLTVAAYLSTVSDLSLTTTSASQSAATLTPSPTISGTTILILDTPTGFLRVRTTINGEEMGRVVPGEIYEFVSEQGSWFEIKLKDGRNGWISSQYAKKQD